jgi:hypothetical protein
MNGIADSIISDALRDYATSRFTGVLKVEGQPGGTVYLQAGDICGCETSGAPSLEVVLLRSRRISEPDWNATFSAAAMADRPMTTELVTRQLLGGGEIEALLRTALADSVFALVSGRIDGWTELPSRECALALSPPAKVGWLLAEAARRRQVLAATAEPPLGVLDLVTAAPVTDWTVRLAGPGQPELLALANGRRTARDLAFALGRGVYATMLQLTRMREHRMVVITPHGSKPPPPSAPAGIASDQEGNDRTTTGLPRRRKERLGPQRAAEPGRRNFPVNIQMLRPRRAEGTSMPGEPSTSWLPDQSPKYRTKYFKTRGTGV